MKAVVDANVYLKAVLSEPNSDKAKKFIDEYRAGTHELNGPVPLTKFGPPDTVAT